MFYDRQVKYFDDMIQGERKGNGGFVKIEVRDSICNVHLCVKGLGKVDSNEVSVYLESSDNTVRFCALTLKEGCGTKQLQGLNAENIGDTGIAYRKLQTVKILLSSERELCAIFKRNCGQAEIEISMVPELTAAEEKNIVEELVVENAEPKEIVVSEENVVPEGDSVPEENHESEESSVGTVPEKKSIPLKETKWKQLWEIYPHISPFQDERKYLSVSPADFVILSERYFTMVNNSFLLHGYYNYHHLVLKRLEIQGQVKYYIGVPGNYYDREKQVAVMFGFESFECMQEPAESGDFGYYLMGIEL